MDDKWTKDYCQMICNLNKPVDENIKKLGKSSLFKLLLKKKESEMEDPIKLEDEVKSEPESEIVASISDEDAPESVEVSEPVYSSNGLLTFEFGNNTFEIQPEADGENYHYATRNDGVPCRLQVINGELKKIQY